MEPLGWQRFVLEAVANDYEQLRDLKAEVLSWTRPADKFTTDTTLESVLLECLAKGQVSAYQLSSSSPFAIEVSFTKEKLDEAWFFITEKGREFLGGL